MQNGYNTTLICKNGKNIFCYFHSIHGRLNIRCFGRFSVSVKAPTRRVRGPNPNETENLFQAAECIVVSEVDNDINSYRNARNSAEHSR